LLLFVLAGIRVVGMLIKPGLENPNGVSGESRAAFPRAGVDILCDTGKRLECLLAG
jgi:hypothetical protein